MSFAIRCSASGKVVGSAYCAELAQQLSSELASVVGNPLEVDTTRRVPTREHDAVAPPLGLRRPIQTS